MTRLFFPLIIALCIHYSFTLFLPSVFINKPENAVPEIKSIMIDMSYREPEIVKVPVLPPKNVPQPIKKEQKPPAKIKKVSTPIPKQKKRTPKKIYIKKEPVTPSIEVPKQKTAPKPEKKTPPMELQPEESKTPILKPQRSATKNEAPLKNIKKQEEKVIQKPSVKIIKPTQNPIQTILFSDPEYRNNPSPTYPKKARKRGYEGLVELLVLISVDGRASQVKIKKSTNYSILDKQATKTVQKWVFKPRRSNGQAIETWVIVPIRFKLY